MSDFYKNANIETVEEFCHRAIDGEVFYDREMSKVYFNDTFFKQGLLSPFIIRNSGKREEKELRGLFDLAFFKELRVKVEWHENLSKNYQPLCWVSKEYIEQQRTGSLIARITGKNKNGEFASKDGCLYSFAQPINVSELDK